MTSELSKRINEKCAICNLPRAEHADKMHAFTTTPNDLRERPTPEPQRPRPPAVVSTDVALRLALIEAGVVSAEQILAAEHKLGFYAAVDAVGQPEEAPANATG